MPLPTSRLSYKDCFKLLDGALADKVGLRVRCRDYKHAQHLRSRLHYARKLDRISNKEIYPDPESPLHGRSPYDPLTCSMEKDSKGYWWIVLRNVDATEYVTESLDGIDESANGDNGEATREAPVEKPVRVGAAVPLAGERRRA